MARYWSAYDDHADDLLTVIRCNSELATLWGFVVSVMILDKSRRFSECDGL